MPDTPEAPAPAPAATPEAPPATPAAPVAPAAPAAPATPAADLFDDAKVDQFPRTYVEQLRQEAAAKRTALKEYEDSFKGWSPEEQAVWKQIIQLSYNDPKQGAAKLREAAEILGADDEPPAPKDGDDKPLTRKEIEEFYSNKEKESAQKAALADLQAAAKGLGYDIGGWKYKALLHRAEMEFDCDIDKAHAAMQADERATVDAFVADKIAKGEKWPQTTTPGAPAPADQGGGPPKSMDGARESLRAKLLGK